MICKGFIKINVDRLDALCCMLFIDHNYTYHTIAGFQSVFPTRYSFLSHIFPRLCSFQEAVCWWEWIQQPRNLTAGCYMCW